MNVTPLPDVTDNTSAVTLLCVLLVLWVEVMYSVCDDVFRVHSFLQVAGDRLKGDGSTRTDLTFLWRVQTVWESVAQSNRCEEHLNTDDEVLVTCSHRTRTSHRFTILRVEVLNTSCFLNDSQHKT